MMQETDTDVCIVGAGASGLYLALRLTSAGFSVAVIEKQEEPLRHTRSIGIHPPGADLMQEAGVLEELRNEAVQVRTGKAMDRNRDLGTLVFSSKEEERTILALPQFITERVLENKIGRHIIHRGVVFTSFDQDGSNVIVKTSAGDLKARFLVGADGMNSSVRKTAAIDWVGKTYPQQFCMGDYSDNTPFGAMAVILLTPGGMIESFPLPGRIRRWVAQIDAHETPDAQQHAERIHAVTGILPDYATNSMFSRFTTHGFAARNLAIDSVLLIGDAAHVCSPIGGQGMNLGWMNARTLETTLTELRRAGFNPEIKKNMLRRWESDAIYRAKKVIRRAEFNMKLGGASRFHGIRCAVVKLLLSSPFSAKIARQFTMHGI